MFSLISKARALNLDLDLQIDLFDSIVQPVSLCWYEVWGPGGGNTVNKTQLKYYKHVQNLKRCTSTNMVLGEPGKIPIDELIKCRLLNYWFNIVSCKNEYEIDVVLYKMLLKMAHQELHLSPWIDYVRKCLIELGMSNLWLNQEEINVSHQLFKNAVKLRITDEYKNKKGNYSVFGLSVCTVYRVFKSKFTTETYLKVLPKNLVLKMLKFRCRNSRFLVVTEGYDNYQSGSVLCL